MEKTGGSRLLQMQARFQQKQMQEREMKIASLYEAQQARALDRVRHSPSNGVSASSTPPQQTVAHQPGKVRQMFEERRTKGIDKSYPLQPIHNTDRPARKTLPNGYTKVTASTTNTSSRSVEKRTTKAHITTSSHSVKKQHHKIEKLVNGSGDLNHNHEPDLNSVKHSVSQSNGELVSSNDELISTKDELISSKDDLDNGNKDYLLDNETFPDALAPMPTPRSPEPQPEVKKPPTRHPAPKTSAVKIKPQSTTTPPRRVISENAVTESSKARGAMQRTANPVPRRQPSGSGGGASANKARSTTASAAAAHSTATSLQAGSGTACTICGRRFATDRISKHQEICKKAHAKKRKPFDALKHRLAGTEAEPFINKLRKGTPSSTKVSSKPLNNTWRQKHEEFIQAIRAAKQVQAHLSAGGKLSDLPPPPPSENPDYVQCPHCNRRFNQGAAERHIPKCASYQFNKPKPAAKRR